MEGPDQKKCIGCGNAIPTQARVCNYCSSFQSAWKNNLRYLANVMGLFSVIVSAVAFIISTIPTVRQVVAWHDEVKVLTFASNKPVTIVNTGDGDVFITHINIRGSRPSGRNYSDTERISGYVEAGSLITDNREIPLEEYSIATSTDPEDIEGLLNMAELFSSRDACVRMVFAVPDDPGYATFKSYLGEKMITFDVEATIRFFSIKKQTYIVQEIPMSGYLVIQKDPSCLESN